jgi:type IV secretory pathway VirB10-like protein
MLLRFTLRRHTAGIGLSLLAVLLASAPAHAQWKWRDARGQIHISDIPPPRDVPDKDVLQRPDPAARKPAAAPAAAASAAVPLAAPGKAAVDPELEERKRKAEQDQAARQKADDKQAKAARSDNCQRAREQLATMDSGVRVMRVKPDGEREYMTEEQRAGEAQRARTIIASDCR